MNLNNLFTALFFATFVFIFWREAKKNGFDEYKTTDMLAILAGLTAAVWLLIKYSLGFLSIFYRDIPLLRVSPWLTAFSTGYLIWAVGLLSFAKRQNWSYYRLVDIFAVSLSGGVFWVLLLAYSTIKDPRLFYLAPAFLLPNLIFLALGTKLLSGSVFVLQTLIYAAAALFVPGSAGRLPISILFFTIALFVVYLRRKKAMKNSNITQDFLKFIKDRLYKRDSQLQKQESLLKAEDPFLQPGRSEGNAEEMDEAILEDNLKEITDAKMGAVKGMRGQIKRALSFLRLGKYGVCEICGKPIDKARLTAYPEATKCLSCASKSEK